MLIPIGLASIVIGCALLVVTTAIYILGRNRMRGTARGLFVGARPRLKHRVVDPLRSANKFYPQASQLYCSHRAAGIGSFQ